jgi:hypothetical protein
MPRYQVTAEVPAETTRGGQVRERIEVDERFIERGLRFAAPGSAFEVKAVVTAGDRVLLPTAASDPTVIPGNRQPAPINARLPGLPSEIEVRAWAPDADFPHTLKVFLDLTPEEEARPLQRLTARLSGSLGGVRAVTGRGQDS